MTMSSRVDALSAMLGARVEAGVRVVRLRGELDAFSAQRLRDDLRREVEARPALVALDLSDLEEPR
jgi:anti-anti-sigma regulatory factor